MKHLTWPSTVIVLGLIAAIVVMYCYTSDATLRQHLMGYFNVIASFIVGAGAGGTVSGVVAYHKGKAA